MEMQMQMQIGKEATLKPHTERNAIQDPSRDSHRRRGDSVNVEMQWLPWCVVRRRAMQVRR